MTFVVSAATAKDTRAIGERLGRVVVAGDVILLTGELGAGKTTFVQGLGAGLRVRGDITSPTFVIARVHAPLGDGPALVHVDAFRLGDQAELDDVDIDAFVDDAVTVVEWGEGVAEALSDDRLVVYIVRPGGSDVVDESRTVSMTPIGTRWAAAPLSFVLAGTPPR
ncbi:MAG: tRNA (adenosine(37)-N6)-threonylcarbamoyltransferase complex ATPase subunit type 1 TsaE [Nocardioidaceae bacterium]